MAKISKTVLAFQNVRFEGDVIPHAWYQNPIFYSKHTKKKEPHVDLKAIVILADVIYWYRPTVIRDEITGHVIELRQKFKADKLQVSYEQWAKRFGQTKRQVQDTFAFLKERGLVTIELRSAQMGGMMVGNVVYVEPVVDKIFEISNLDRLTKIRDRGHENSGEGSQISGTPITDIREINTYNTTEITPDMLGKIAAKVNKNSYDQWFLNSTVFKAEEEKLIIFVVPTETHKEWITSNYFDVLEEVLEDMDLEDYKVGFEIKK